MSLQRKYEDLQTQISYTQRVVDTVEVPIVADLLIKPEVHKNRFRHKTRALTAGTCRVYYVTRNMFWFMKKHAFMR